MEFKPVYCSSETCKKKVIGEIATGTARFKCKTCGTLTTVTIEATPAPPRIIQPRKADVRA